MATQTAKPADKSSKDDSDSKPKTVVPDKPDGKGETRLFQTSPDKHEWLTQSEAEDKGHFWRDEKKHGKA